MIRCMRKVSKFNLYTCIYVYIYNVILKGKLDRRLMQFSIRIDIKISWSWTQFVIFVKVTSRIWNAMELVF